MVAWHVVRSHPVVALFELVFQSVAIEYLELFRKLRLALWRAAAPVGFAGRAAAEAVESAGSWAPVSQLASPAGGVFLYGG